MSTTAVVTGGRWAAVMTAVALVSRPHTQIAVMRRWSRRNAGSSSQRRSNARGRVVRSRWILASSGVAVSVDAAKTSATTTVPNASFASISRASPVIAAMARARRNCAPTSAPSALTVWCRR